MQGVISFHPVDPGFFETLIEPLLRGEKVNPATFVDSALRVRRASWLILRYKIALLRLLEEVEPPPPPDEGTLWERVRARLERFDYKVPPLARVAHATLEPDLHLHGRPFLVSEASPDRVAELVAQYAGAAGDAAVTSLVLDQLARLDAGLARGLTPEPIAELSSDGSYRSELLGKLKQVHDWGQANRDSRTVAADDAAWQVVHLHSRAVPFWIARDVDGLATICGAAGIEPPAGLGSAARLFAGVAAEFPGVREGLHEDVQGSRDLGAYVAPESVPELRTFLVEHGGRMIQVATRHGQGRLCTQLLRKIRECVRFAERYGVGYLEASGIHPLLEEPAETEESVEAVPLVGV